MSYKPLAAIRSTSHGAMMGILACITRCAIGFPGGEDKELTEERTGAAPWWTPVNWARDLEACAHRRGCCQLWLREGVAKGSGLARAVAAARAGRAGGTASRCAGRVGFFPLVLWALFIRELGVREDQTARVPLELLRMTWLSPQQVLARCLAPDTEALTSAPAFQQSYWSDQHAPLVPRSVGRQQCPHPCFLPAATRADSGSFAA